MGETCLKGLLHVFLNVLRTRRVECQWRDEGDQAFLGLQFPSICYRFQTRGRGTVGSR